MRSIALSSMRLFATLIGLGLSPGTNKDDTLAKESAAPPLTLTEVLQVPPSEHTDWAHLRGKVVVLEFWATWCGPCVAAIPHLNRLVATTDPKRVQFISIDDEDSQVVKSFLAKRSISGWIGIDSTGRTIARYNALQRPTTIVVDKSGRIAAITTLDALTAANLALIADGKAVDLPQVSNIKINPSIQLTSSKTAPLVDVAFTPAAPGTHFMTGRSEAGNILIQGASASQLLALAFKLPGDRFLVKSSLPDGIYTLRAALGGAPPSISSPVLQGVVLAGLHLEAKEIHVKSKVLVLHSSSRSSSQLNASTGSSAHMAVYRDETIRLIGGSIDDLASQVENVVGVPVVNESGISGAFDINVKIPGQDASAAIAELDRTLGLIATWDEREVPMMEIAPVTVSPTADHPQ